MRSFFQHKYGILALSVIALGALAVLAVGLRDLSFSAAQPLFREDAESPTPLPPRERIGDLFGEISVQSQITFWGIAGLLVVLIGLLLTPDGRKALLRIFLRTAATYWALYFFMKYYGEQIASMFNFEGRMADAMEDSVEAAPPPVFEPPQPSPWLSYTASILVILFILFVLWRLFVHGARVLAERGNGEKPLKEIARIARSSLRELKADGMDSTDVIMNCYFRMSRVVADKRKLTRADSMTPAEFASQLEQAGLPGDAVRRLTRLFEGVRYGDRRSGPRDVNEAVACLTSILTYCGEMI
ncbi:MAG: DUF4129 domain-containing protein [Chloroflexi bacterium]|nr:DUF4129 domain-containing protein [Chloroflexota bacterium]